MQPQSGGGEPHSPREHQQPYQQRDYQQGGNQQPRHQQHHNNQPRYDRQDRQDRQENRNDHQPRQDHQPRYDNRPAQQSGGSDGDVSSLPSFITGGGQPQQNAPSNGHDLQGDRFRGRRRRHQRDMQGGAQSGVTATKARDEATPQPEQTPQPSE